jgi:drug/metabolite transporter (DMT)-like permease
VALSARLLALLAAVLFAVGSVLQQRGALAAPPASSRGFLASILRKPVWLAGAASQGLGWVAQALALDRGDLFSVQLIISLQVVIVLPLGVLLASQRVQRREWLGAAAVVTGLGIFVVLANPTPGRDTAPAGTWLVAAIAIGFLLVVLVLASRHTQASQRAALLAAAAGASFGFQAAVMKVFVGVAGRGLHAVVSSWSTYALIASAVLGFFLMQLSLQAGALSATVAGSNASTTLTSLALSRYVFLETPSRTTSGKILSFVAVALALAGLLEIARGAERRSTRDRRY